MIFDKAIFLSIVFIRGANERFQSNFLFFFLLLLGIKCMIFIISKMAISRIQFLPCAAQVFDKEENVSNAAKQSMASNRPGSNSLGIWKGGLPLSWPSLLSVCMSLTLTSHWEKVTNPSFHYRQIVLLLLFWWKACRYCTQNPSASNCCLFSQGIRKLLSLLC